MAEAPWNPDWRQLVEARERLVEAGVPSSQLRVKANAPVWGDTRVRLGHDGRWWRFAERSGRWELSAAPTDDVDDLVGDPDEYAPP